MQRSSQHPTILILGLFSFILMLSGCKKPPIPEVYFMTPDIGKIGTTVRIDGKYLTYFQELVVGGVEVDEVLFDTIENEKLVFRIPADVPPGFAEVFLVHDRGETEPFLFENLGNGPQIKAILPESGMPGTTVEIIGSALSNTEVAVNLGALLLEEIVLVSDTLINARIPEAAPTGLDFITVTIGNCTSNRKAFTVTAPAVPAPIITSVDPMFARVGDTICINGQNFLPDNTMVTFEPSTPASILSLDSTAIKVIVPPRSKSGPITVQTTAVDAGVSETVTLLPKITDFNPKSGATDTIVNIMGWNFENLSQVTFNNIPALLINTATDTTVTVQVPPLDVFGLIPVLLETSNGISNEVEFLVTDTCGTLQPTLTSINQNTAQPGDTLIVSGTNFLPEDIKIQLANSPEFDILSISDSTQIEAIVPVTVDCIMGSIQVTTRCGSSNTLSLTIDKTPIIDSLSTPMAQVGQSVSIFGTFWDITNYELKLGDQSITLAANDILPNRINFSVPEGAESGALVLSGSCGSSNSINLTIVASTPVINSLSQSCAVAGDQLTILGQNFVPGESQVFINGQSAPIISSTEAELVVTVPARINVVGNTSVEVVNPMDNRSAPANLTIIQLPAVPSFLPQRNPAKGVLILKGEDLDLVDRIRFGSDIYLTQAANQFIWLSAFDEIGLNLPEELSLGTTQVCLESSPCEKTYEVCFDYEIIGGEVGNPGPGAGRATTIVLPNPPFGSSLGSISNNWSLSVYNPFDPNLQVLDAGLNLDSQEAPFDCSGDPSQVYTFSDTNGEGISGSFSLDGSNLSLTINGKEYVGRQDSSFLNAASQRNSLNSTSSDCPASNLPFRVIFTPVESGDQLEMIFPYVITDISVHTIDSNASTDVTVTGRVFDNPSTSFSDFQGTVVFRGPLEGQAQEIEVPVNEQNITATTLTFTISAGSLSPGTYEVSVREDNQFSYSNVLSVEVN